MSEKQTFTVLLEKHENMDATGITIPFDVEEVFGAKRVPVKVRVNGAEHRSTIVRVVIYRHQRSEKQETRIRRIEKLIKIFREK